MKNGHLFSILIFLLLLACRSTPEKPKETTNAPTTSGPIALAGGQIILNDIEASAFSKIQGDSIQKLLVQQFCEDSKGYRANTWLGLNKCSWAIEKYRLDQNPVIIQRNETELQVVLPNGQKESFLHDLRDPEQPVYYQFQRYFSKQDQVLIKKMAENACPQYLLLCRKDGKKIWLDGIPHFDPSGTCFVLNGHQDECLHTIEYWTLSANHVDQVWSIDRPDWAVEEIKWSSPKEFAVGLASGSVKASSTGFVGFRWQE